jgi:eukaryotic-like serine/threonine-protein kinase
MTSPLPQAIGSYQVESSLGTGAMGVVYKGYDPNIKRHVALKTVRKELLGSDAERFLARLRVEAEAAGRMSHPNIVTIYGFLEHEGAPVIVMEFAAGRPLDELLLANGSLERGKAIDIVAQLLEALEYAHKQGVVHRDIKPANIMVGHDGQIKVMDFGVAKLQHSDLTMVGEVMGTPNYMSPEQWLGESVDHRSDLFAAGVVLYHALTGEKPFAAESIGATKNKALRSEPPSILVLNPKLPAALDEIVRKAMAKRPDDRFASAKEFIQALRAVDITPAAQGGDETILYGAKAPDSTKPKSKPPKPTHRRYLLAGVAFVALAAAAGVTFIGIGKRAEPIGYVSVSSDPVGATLLLDGTKLLGVTPTRVELPSGEHHLSLKKAGFYDWEASVEVEAKKDTPLEVTLNKVK